jgi:integrase
VNGKPEHHPEGTYHLRYVRSGKRVWEAVGTEPAQALAKLARREKIQVAIAAGAQVVEPEKPKANPRRLLQKAVDEYLGDISKYKAPRTYESYRLALETFVKTCSREEPAQVDRRDIFNYVDALTDEGLSDRTKFNRISNVLTFFRRRGLPPIIHASEMPTYTEKLVAVYTKRELAALFKACTPEEQVLFQFFLGSGCRDSEVVHACWEDLDFDHCTYSVKATDEYEFRPKDHEEREIPLSNALIELLRAHRRLHPEERLLFPREDGRPNHHLLRILKEVALGAGLNCGRCRCDNGQTCLEFRVCGDWQLHSFRRTFATMHAAAGVKIHEISRWCGHASIETTQRCLATTAPRSEEVRGWVNGTFADFVQAGA